MSKPVSALVSWSQVATATGYVVYWGTSSRSYPYHQDVGTNLRYRVTGLRHGQAYYFAGKSYNSSRTSTYSNEVKRTV